MLFAALVLLAGVGVGFVDAAADDDKTPAVFHVAFITTVNGTGSALRGSFVLEVKRAWSPRGADRFFKLVKSHFYDQCGFFRVVKGFVVQFGLAALPYDNQRWRDAIDDDPRVPELSNGRGMVAFATSGPHTRTTQLFINLGDNNFLDAMGFTPIGKIVKGMDVVDRITDVYKERPVQSEITIFGNTYLKDRFPKLDYIVSARILES